jgi:hypothetical protein
MKKLMLATMSVAVIFATSCRKDSALTEKKELVPSGTAAPDTLVGEVTVNSTVTRATYIKGIVYVKPNVTLTVNAGVTITGSLGGATFDLVNLANNKGTLVIEKGGKLVANGTPTSPIVWTSPKTPGTRSFGDWGGVVLLGQAPIHTATGASSNTFEAFAAIVDARNTYGGTIANDNSGSMTYNRFEFGGGVVVAAGKEVNGFTLCGVGNGTTFHHNEVSNAGDDAFEFFGGTVNVDHLLSFANKDDDFDFDEGYEGNLQFIIGYRTNLCDNSGSHEIESDNDASATNGSPVTLPFIANATLIGPADTSAVTGGAGVYFEAAMKIRRNTRLRLVNSLIISQKNRFAVLSTPTTYDRFAASPSLSDSIIIGYNIFQTNSALPVVKAAGEGDPSFVPGNDAALTAKLGGPALGNSVLGAIANFKLDGALKPLPTSPALSGGANLASFGLPFVGTTQRGGVITTDPWTTTGTWISTATN